MEMISVQYYPDKKMFRLISESKNIICWRSLVWLIGCFAARNIPYNWQVVIDNP